MVSGVEPYPELDQKCIAILKSLDRHDGTATTTEIRTSSSVETRQEIHYRVDGSLEPRGFVTTHQPQGEPGKTPPKEFTLTDDGREVLETVADREQLNDNLGGRVQQLEDQMDAVLERLDESDEVGKHNGSDTVESEQIMELIEAVERAESRLDEIESNPIFDEDMQAQLNAVMIFSGISKDTYVEERGDDYLDEQWPEKREKLQLFQP
jgi:DNA-binding PadR family transcriptional regulator